MTTLSILLQQIKEKEDRDLAYTKKIKSAETLIKAEQDTVKKIKFQKRELSDGIKRKYFSCSGKEITREILQQQKQNWQNLLQEARKNLEGQEKKFDELQQGVCLSWLVLYNDIKGYLDKKERYHSSKSFCNTLPVLMGKKIKIEQDETSYENIMEEQATLENQLEELKYEENQNKKTIKLKEQVENEPSQGVEFLWLQREMKEEKDALANTEREILSLKNEIPQKELQILNKKSISIGVKPAASQDLGEMQRDYDYKTVCHVTQDATVQGNPSASKTVTFKSTVDIKNISPQFDNKFVLPSEDKITLSGRCGSRKKRTQLSSRLDERMRDILFKD